MRKSVSDSVALSASPRRAIAKKGGEATLPVLQAGGLTCPSPLHRFAAGCRGPRALLPCSMLLFDSSPLKTVHVVIGADTLFCFAPFEFILSSIRFKLLFAAAHLALLALALYLLCLPLFMDSFPLAAAFSAGAALPVDCASCLAARLVRTGAAPAVAAAVVFVISGELPTDGRLCGDRVEAPPSD